MKFKIYYYLFIFCFTLINVSNAFSGQNIREICKISPAKKIIIIEPSIINNISLDKANDLNSIKNVLTICGITFSTITVENMKSLNLNNYNIIIVPNAATKQITTENIFQIKEAVTKGSGVFFDSISEISNAFGLKILQEPIYVNNIFDTLFNKTILYWPDTIKIYPIDTTSRNYKIISIDNKTRQPLMVSDTFGKGKFIYFSNLFDPYTNKGYSRYPYLIELFNSTFGLMANAERRIAEMYFDPGMHESPIDYNMLAKKWQLYKIKKVYAAGWYYDDDNIDYAQLIKSCHENGILVSCWLEPPMISKGFWDKNPDWREKTAKLNDAHVDWRYLMNLSDSSCRKKIFEETKQFLMKYNWDGVNLAELYFDPVDDGRQNPANFTPMNNTIRNEFKNNSGFDPFLLFDSTSNYYWGKDSSYWMNFISYRKDLCYRSKIQFLDFLTEIYKQKNNFELMLTAIDVSLTPLLSDYIGEDFQNTLALYNKYPITLQIEDPSNCWGLTPERYNKLGKCYSSYIKDKNRLVFDCNVVASHEKGFGGFPSEKPSGEEIRQIVYNMSLSGTRPAFYSEDAFFASDFKNISRVLARETKIEPLTDSTCKVITPYTVTIDMKINDQEIYLDNKEWHAIEQDKIIIPSGEHLLWIKSTKRREENFCLKLISGDLLEASFTDNFIHFTYNELFSSCYVIVNKKPSKIIVDNAQIVSEVLNNSSGDYSIKLPTGKHRVKVIQ